MGIQEQEKLAGQLKTLLEATKLVRGALLRADSVAMQKAIESQATSLQLLEQQRDQLNNIRERSELILLVHQIHALNRNNQALTRGGLRVINATIQKSGEGGSYSDDGTSSVLPNTSRLSTSA